MKPIELKVTRIGNSRGIRIPAPALERYDIGERVIMEERSDGILLRATATTSPKLSWEETARAMATSDESWSDWTTTLADGLDALPWDSANVGRVAESGEVPVRRSRKK
jgi:antitoxin component of MazEF toxin-antitoxin module